MTINLRREKSLLPRASIVFRGAGLLLLTFATASAARAQEPAPPPLMAPQAKVITARASGTFEVKLTPQAADEYADGSALGRMTIDKQFRGDLSGLSKGQMLTGMSPVKGSAGYVAIERVSGTLAGRRGSFVLQHSGTMARGTPTLTISVVPDSGADELIGLSGTMVIVNAGGQHSYEFTYSLPPRP